MMSTTITTTITSIDSGCVQVDADSGFQQQYDSIDLFRRDLQRYCFEAKKNIREDRLKKSSRVHHYVCAHCDSWRLILTAPRTKKQKTQAASEDDREEDSEDEEDSSSSHVNDKEAPKESKVWRIADKSRLIHGKKVIGADGNQLLEPCVGGIYKAPAVSIYIQIKSIKIHVFIIDMYIKT